MSIAKEHRALVDAEFALNSDGGGGTLDDDTGKPLYYSLQTAEKTYADFTVTARNPGGHSSQPRDDNAIYDLAAALLKVRDYKFPVMWNDTTLASCRQAGTTTRRESSARHGASSRPIRVTPPLPRSLHASPSYVGQTRTTCVATMLDGGHGENALPQSAGANVNCRIFPGVKIEDVRLALQQAAGSGVEVKLVGEPLSSDASPLRPDVVKAVTRAVHKHPARRAGGSCRRARVPPTDWCSARSAFRPTASMAIS